VLGCGTSTGVPRIGNDWGECDPNEPKNRRSRVSIMVESDEGARLLVDTSTDLRQQLLDNGSTRSTRCSGPTTTPTTATDRRLRPMRFSTATRRCRVRLGETARSLRSAFSYVFSAATVIRRSSTSRRSSS
jgi:phosphoribosyl 1,2-cyclic phosphate phosphodiesterase